MDNKSLLELCLKVTGSFENGAPAYDAVTGNFDGQGLSVGVLQWNAGSGTLQVLLNQIAANMTWPTMQSFFKSDIHHLAVLKPSDAVQFCIQHYLQPGEPRVALEALICWQSMLQKPESIDAQVSLATSTVLTRAQTLAKTFCPNDSDRTRVMAFFFDLVTQSGGMQNSRGKVLPVSGAPGVNDALDYAQQKNPKCAQLWTAVVKNDPLAAILLHYAYQRSLLSNPDYVWDALSRRGTIACRMGIVHNSLVDLSATLD